MKIFNSTTRVLAFISTILGLVADFVFVNYYDFSFIRHFLRFFGVADRESIVLFFSLFAIFLGSIALHKDNSIPTRFFAILGILTGMFVPTIFLLLGFGLIPLNIGL